jgi:endonuclease-3
VEADGQPDLAAIVAILAGHYEIPAHPVDPLELVLWENVGYLVDDDRRRALFDRFGRTIGFGAAQILAADDAALLALAADGGMRPEQRVARWREIAALVLEQCGGALDRTLRALPLPRARALLRRFPGLGDPGADKVLLFAGIAARPCLESNGLRVLARLGLFEPGSSYAASYRAAITVLVAEGPADRDWLVSAWLLLRAHGKALCRRGAPSCWACPLDGICPKRDAGGL